jgi:hypothetical protein
MNMPPEHVNFFTPGSLRRLLRAGGFGGVRTRTGGGLKWENLLGRRIVRDVAIECDGADTPVAAGAAGRRPGFRAVIKQAVKTTVVRPLFYDGLKVGMLLVGLARRP